MQRMVALSVVLFLVSLSPFYAHGGEKGGAYYDFGVFAFEDGDYDDAIKSFEKALESDPNNPFYNQFMGKALFQKKKYKRSRKYFSRAWKVDPELSGLKYDVAMLNFKQSDYKGAADLFKEVVREEPTNLLAAYYAGVSLYKDRNYAEAVTFFTGEPAKNPGTRVYAHYFTGICSHKLGQNKKASDAFLFVEKNAKTNEMRRSAQRWLRLLDGGGEEKRYRLYLKAGRVYDDNVKLEPIDSDIWSDESDYAYEGFFSGKVNLYNGESFVTGLGYSHYQIWWDDLSQYDLTASMPSLYLKYRFSPVELGISYLPAYYWVDSESYLAKHRIKPQLLWFIRDDLMARISYVYSNNSYFTDYSRDGDSNEFRLDGFYSFMGGKSLFTGGLGYETNSATRDTHDYEKRTARLGLSLKLPWEFSLSLTGRYYEKDYKETEREDTKYYGSAALSRPLFFDWLGAVIDVNYTKNDSNYTTYEYERQVTSLSMTVSF